MAKEGISVGEAIVAGKEVLMNMINELIEEFRPTMTLEDLQRVYTKTVDEVIFKEEDKSNSRYVGGEFNLTSAKKVIRSATGFSSGTSRKKFSSWKRRAAN